MTLGIRTWKEPVKHSDATQCRCARKPVWVKVKWSITTSRNMNFLRRPKARNWRPALIIYFSLIVSQMMYTFLKKWVQQLNRREAGHCEISWGSGDRALTHNGWVSQDTLVCWIVLMKFSTAAVWAIISQRMTQKPNPTIPKPLLLGHRGKWDPQRSRSSTGSLNSHWKRWINELIVLFFYRRRQGC